MVDNAANNAASAAVGALMSGLIGTAVYLKKVHKKQSKNKSE